MVSPFFEAKMKELLFVITPITGLFGIFIGAFLQAHFTRKNQKSNHLSELQNRAYADFLNAASNVAVFQRLGQREKVSNELSKLADAKSRICVYGESIVIKKMAEFFRHGGTLQTESEMLSFTQLCLSIRNSVGIKQDKVCSTDISQLLFSVDVKDTPTPQCNMPGKL
jgi:hypothetical protein